MGYTHYWSREKTIPAPIFIAIRQDFEKLLIPMANAGILLADAMGEGVPLLKGNRIRFNGLAACGHTPNDAISIPWPSVNAGGIGSNQTGQDGEWFAGAVLDTRCCNGDCSYESFIFDRIFQKEYDQQKPDSSDHWFAFCKTAFRPYDIAVTAALVIAKHHLGDRIRVSTDGEDQHWFDAKMLCQTILGYGIELAITGDDSVLEPAQVVGVARP